MMFETIKKLTAAFGPSGCEKGVASVIRSMIGEHVDEIRENNLGNLIAVKRGKGKKIMLAAHMDEIGLIVSFIDEKGFLRFGKIGGVNQLVALGQRVVFGNGITGVVWYEENMEKMKDAVIEKMYIDIGARSEEEAKKMVGVGDMAVFQGDAVEQNGMIISKTLDDRAGCAILAELAMSRPETDNEIYYVFTSQEEVGLRGAKTAAYGIMPDIAVAVDVTKTGDTPNCRPMALKLGAGPAIKIKDGSVIAHPKVKDMLVKAAAEAGVPYQFEVLEQGGTDAGSIHITAGGIPSGGVSIPARFVHSASETADLGDIENALSLLRKFVCLDFGGV
jgi:putative aminopeptidase FrvX